MAFNYDTGGATAAPGRGRDGHGIELIPLNSNNNGSRTSSAPQTPKTPRKILNMSQSSSNQQTPKKLQFSTPEVHTVPPSPMSLVSPTIKLPNRKREEAIVMANLRKKVPASHLTRRRVVTGNGEANHGGGNEMHVDNRPSIPKISSKTGISLMDNNNNNTNYEDSASVKASATFMQDKDFILELLCWHNEYRARHAVTALTISTELCEYAQTWANHLANANEFYYRSDKTIGQNLFCCPLSALVTDLTGQEVASFWYSTVRKYNFYKVSHLLHTNVNAGHFCQMIWSSSKYLGVGKASSKGKIFVVAFYFPPGNLVDEYHTNVPPPIVEQDMVPGNSPKLIDGDSIPILSILKQ